MKTLRGFQPAAFGAAILAANSLAAAQTPAHFGLYYSGPPCAAVRIDRTFSQFQVNLAEEAELVRGRLRAGPDGEAVLVGGGSRPVRLLSNASRADWLLSYPLLEEEVGVWARPILQADCSVATDTLYVEALFPSTLLQGPIDPRLDLSLRPDALTLLSAVARYRQAFVPDAERDAHETYGPRGDAADLEREIFAPGHSTGEMPWRVRLFGDDREIPASTSVEILLSGSDGSVGMFGHISVGGGFEVYNIYPKGSDRGAPGKVPLWDYLFNTQRGQALRRPTWILRLEGLPAGLLAEFHRALEEEIRAIDEGRAVYHPTANNCTVVSLKALEVLGFEVSAARYFTRRFPRPAFEKILARLPRLVLSGRLPVERVELMFIPQVPVRVSEGGAPNRPLRDRGRIAASSGGSH
jgi:hypothetical protein